MALHILSFAFMLLLAAAGASAQSMYKSTMPDGKVVYGEKPEPGATKVVTIEPPPPKSGITIVTPEDRARVDQSIRQRTAIENEQRRQLEEARRQLEQAEAARKAGEEPLPGERLGTLTGGSRLTEDYWERQKKLEQAVEAARARLEKAQQAVR
jgi:hypothetical protein